MTLSNELNDIFLQARLVEPVFNSLNHLILAEMSNQTSSMYFPREKIPEGCTEKTSLTELEEIAVL